MKLHLIDSNLEVAAAMQTAFARFAEVEVRHGDLLAVAEQCVVSPANSFGFMDGGFDKELFCFFGPQIEIRLRDAIARRPEGLLPVGASLLLHTGQARIPYLLVAPTTLLPEHVEPVNAYRAMRAILRISRSEAAACSRIYCPGLATGVGGVAPSEAADQMARAYSDFIDTENAKAENRFRAQATPGSVRKGLAALDKLDAAFRRKATQ
jgi:O-acetyl-ADP-ribose deacetylase (regulator of RNase III)